MLIAQITDMHVVASDQLYHGRVATHAMLERVVEHINQLRPLPDVVIATGDMTEHGRMEEYARLKDILSGLLPKVYLIPGNHDHRANLLATFASDHTYLPELDALFIHYVIDEYPLRLIGLDTVVPQQPHGLMCAERLAWLETTLSAAPNKPTLIFMHHPPFRMGIRKIDAYGLYGGREMEAIVARHSQVKRVIAGHVHRSIQTIWGGTLVCTAPSTCSQLELKLGETDMSDYIMEPPAILLHKLDTHYGLVSHLSYLSGDYEVFKSQRSETPEKVQEKIQGLYEALREAEYET